MDNQPIKLAALSNLGRVTKSNLVIEAHYKLSINEQKFILLMTSKIQPEDTEFMLYKFNAQEIINALGLEKHKGAHGTIREIISSLMHKELRIKVADSFLLSTWVSSVEYFNDGTIEFEFSQKLKPYLLQLNRDFTTYKIRNVLKLRSTFSLRIYEFLKQYEKLGKRVIPLIQLREMLGIGAEEYRLYGDFKRKVLMVAKQEISQKTDITFYFNELKTSRQITHIEFIIQHNTAVKLMETGCRIEAASASTLSDRLAELVKRYPKSPLVEDLEAYFSKTSISEDEYLGALEYTLSKNPNSFFLYLNKVINNDYATPYIFEKAAATRKQSKLEKALEAISKSEDEKAQQEQKRMAEFKSYFSTLSQSEQEALLEEAKRQSPYMPKREELREIVLLEKARELCMAEIS